VGLSLIRIMVCIVFLSTMVSVQATTIWAHGGHGESGVLYDGEVGNAYLTAMVSFQDDETPVVVISLSRLKTVEPIEGAEIDVSAWVTGTKEVVVGPLQVSSGALAGTYTSLLPIDSHGEWTVAINLSTTEFNESVLVSLQIDDDQLFDWRLIISGGFALVSVMVLLRRWLRDWVANHKRSAL